MRIKYAIFIGVLTLTGCGDCDNKVIRELISPDHQWKAILFERSCGATSNFSTQVSIVRPSERLANDSGNAFVADTNHGKAPAASWGGPDVKLKWIATDVLQIVHPPAVRVFKQEQHVQKVALVYIAENFPASSIGLKEKDPVLFASSFYAIELQPRRVAAELDEYQSWLSSDLYSLLVKAKNASGNFNGAPPLDFDPFTSSQEDLELIKVEPIRSMGTAAVVRVWVKVKDGDKPYSFSVFLSMLKGNWKINDFEFGEKEKWRLVKFLKENY